MDEPEIAHVIINSPFFGNLIDPEMLIYVIHELLKTEPEIEGVSIHEETVAHIVNLCEIALQMDMAEWPGPGGPPGLN